jgi:hypothetical protein
MDWPSRLLDISYKLRCMRPTSKHCTGPLPTTGRSLYLNDVCVSYSFLHRPRRVPALAIGPALSRPYRQISIFRQPLSSSPRIPTSKAERGAAPAKTLASTTCRRESDRRDLPRHRQKTGSFSQAEESQKDNVPLSEASPNIGRPAGWCQSDMAVGPRCAAKS